MAAGAAGAAVTAAMRQQLGGGRVVASVARDADAAAVAAADGLQVLGLGWWLRLLSARRPA